MGTCMSSSGVRVRGKRSKTMVSKELLVNLRLKTKKELQKNLVKLKK